MTKDLEKYCDEIIKKHYRPKQPQLTASEAKEIYRILTEQNLDKQATEQLQSQMKAKSISIGCEIAKNFYINHEVDGNFEDILQETLYIISRQNLLSRLKTSQGRISMYKAYLKMSVDAHLERIEGVEKHRNRDIALRKDNKDVISYDTVLDEAPSDNISVEDKIISIEASEKVRKVLKTLSGREALIISMRFCKDMTFPQIASEFELSTERIRQVTAKGLRKLRHPSRAKHVKEYF